LNGDRGILECTHDGLKLWNRYGSEYNASSVDLSGWRNLKPGTLLDGEIYRGEFFCFEEIVEGKDQAWRIATGRATTMILGNKQWVFDGITNDWLIGEVTLDADPRTRMWEGCVMKLANAKYVPLKKPDHESPTWVKLKWC
jgi:hypothetical protein